ncbi:hypothetical protein [Paenibacillus polymyxa]|uniref:hypothetical protein n=1 Tax=Paenibacillus polymyxa TaxID=1406 RepID=UPI0023F7B6D5|nr:hypothetical protein [Paenibacillus polymyxa]
MFVTIEVVGAVIAGVGVVVSGVFSYLLYKVSKDSAKATIDNIKWIKDTEERYKNQHRIQMIRKLNYIYRAVNGQKHSFNKYTIKNAKADCNPITDELSRYYTVKEAKEIQDIWDLFVAYYGEFWFDFETEEIIQPDENNKSDARSEAKICGERIKEKLKTLSFWEGIE